ncbi:uncharacterized protein [Watersipora subatra]
MDVPKITVFKSPPWQKPVAQAASPRLSDVYEEFPTKSKCFSRRINAGGSRSLECIPENMVLQDTHKYSTTHLRDSSRLSPHQVLPPIQRFSDEELPEMRQRAHSDPNKYSALLKKKAEEKKESPLVKPSSPAMHPSPPKDKLNELNKNKPASTSGHRVLRRTNSKELEEKIALNSPNGAIPGMPLSSSHSERVKHGSPLTAKPSDIKLHHPIIRRKSSESIVSNPGTPEKRITRNKTLVNRNLSHEALVTHPAISILKEPARARTNSLPGAFPLKTQVQSPKNLPLRMLKEAKSSVAYALIGSPGRDRWPSPERKTTSYINSDSDSPSADNTDSDSLETIHKLQPVDASEEFKSILCDLTIQERAKQLAAITDPKEYFQRATSWRLK